MKSKSILKMLFAVSVFSLAVAGVARADWLEIEKLFALDGSDDDRFGHSVSISGDYAIVGAHNDWGLYSYSGSAYIFKRDGLSWIQQQAKLLASDGGGRFGYSVSINGDYAIMGAYNAEGNEVSSGSAYVFKRDGETWSEQAKLTASDGASYDHFGYSVSINGDYAIIGAYCDNDNGNRSGSAYIFKRDDLSWIQQAKLLASDGAYGDCFGHSVSISGDYAVVGAYGDDDNGSGSGSAYIFKRDGLSWIQQQAKLLASDGAADDWFGYSVSISSDYAIVGALYDDDNGDRSGSAYVFKRDGETWSEQAKLTASDGAYWDYFSYSVSISGDYAVVGAYYDDDMGTESGSAYVFKREGEVWNEQAKLLAWDGAADDWFGYSVSISSDYAIVGALYDDDTGYDSGSAYIFARCPDSDWTGDCFVDLGDFAILGQAWLSETGDLNWNAGCDISVPSDGVIDEMDLSVFVSDWLEGVY